MSLHHRAGNRSRKRVITVRHATPTHRRVVVLVTQSDDVLGNWLVPLITFEGFSQNILESGEFARDAGIALIVASYIHKEWIRDVPHSNTNELSDEN